MTENEDHSVAPLSDAERLEILTGAVRRARQVIFNYIYPLSGIEPNEALSNLIGILEARKVGRAVGDHTAVIIKVIDGGRADS